MYAQGSYLDSFRRLSLRILHMCLSVCTYVFVLIRKARTYAHNTHQSCTLYRACASVCTRIYVCMYCTIITERRLAIYHWYAILYTRTNVIHTRTIHTYMHNTKHQSRITASNQSHNGGSPHSIVT
jgi:hypothetical protein